MFVASEFTRWPGGLLAIDNIEYAAKICPVKDDIGEVIDVLEDGNKIEVLPSGEIVEVKPDGEIVKLETKILPDGIGKQWRRNYIFF